MNRLFYGIIMVVAAVCFLGLGSSAASDILEMDQMDGKPEMSAPVPGAISDLNYIKEVYASTEPPSGESYNQLATKVFSAGDVVYLVTRYYMANPSDTTRYRILSNAAGSVIQLLISTYTVPSSGTWINSREVSGLSQGIYTVNTVILAPGNHLISSTGYTFVVE